MAFGTLTTRLVMRWEIQILKTISQRLKRRFTQAVVFHLGGDEFAILSGKEVPQEHFLQNIESCL